MKKKKNIRKNTQVIATKFKENGNPTLGQDCEVYTLLDFYNDEKLKKLSLKPYSDDLL